MHTIALEFLHRRRRLQDSVPDTRRQIEDDPPRSSPFISFSDTYSRPLELDLLFTCRARTDTAEYGRDTSKPAPNDPDAPTLALEPLKP